MHRCGWPSNTASQFDACSVGIASQNPRSNIVGPDDLSNNLGKLFKRWVEDAVDKPDALAIL
jgi:hypothetical protein